MTHAVWFPPFQTNKSFLVLFFKKELLFLFFSLFFISPACAVDSPSEMLPNSAQEQRAEDIGHQLRCLVCQNESIEDSGADLAKDLRRIVRQRVVTGDSNEQIIDWMVARYGTFVRLKPPFNWLTAALWLSPVIALALGVAASFAARRRAAPPVAPLSATEQTRLAELTRQG
jgi:cytochrome c-type biogenesis protein CcmH